MLEEQQTKRSLGPGEKPEVRKKYAHMLPKDHATWTMFLQSEANKLWRIWYDVHVGTPMEIPQGAPEYMQAVADGVSRKRIDVVGSIGTALLIIEVKPHANMEAIGQIVTYTNLFVKEFEITGPVQALIVSKTCDTDILETAQRMNVKIIAMEGVTP